MKSKQWNIPIATSLAFATFMQIWVMTHSLSQADKIVALPGQPKVGFQQFSGYITVDDKKQRNLFYYFVEAETDPSSKPLVLWLTGGPGCSSLGIGAFAENGPFKTNGETLFRNEFSWNKEANMLYLESPAGVGFSYSTNKSFYANLNDEFTARDNLVFLQRWFVQFPEYKNRDFYITGDSYAGHFVPQLAQLIIQTNMKWNLKGISIGNPLIEFDTDMNSMGVYAWSHGLISDSTYEQVNLFCNYSQYYRQMLSNNISPTCHKVYNIFFSEVSQFIDKENVIGDVCLLSNGSELNQETVLNPQAGSEKGEVDIVCAAVNITKYLNGKDVQEALHAKLVGVANWNACNSFVGYLKNVEDPTVHIVASLVKSGIRVMVYSGDQDIIIPFIGTRTLIDNLAKELKLKTTVPYRAWFRNKQVGGWTQVYGDILSYATIRGASHLAPYTQPGRSLTLFRAFLAGKPLPAA